jgi:hypothetical protein
VTIAQRRTYLALLASSFIIIVVVSLGRRLTGIDDVVNAVGKYNTYAYLWFTLASFYLLACLVDKIPAPSREAAAAAALLIAVVLFVQYARQDNVFRAEAIRRQREMDSLVAVFENYAAQTAPAPMHIPTLDGNFVYPAHYKTLYKYNLAHYRPFFLGFDKRLTLLRNEAMDPWGGEVGAQEVPSLRAATDAEFIRALETNPDLQSLYLGSVELEPRLTPPPETPPMRLDGLKIEGADVTGSRTDSIAFTTAGGASVMLLPNEWDPEQAHILSINITASLDKPPAEGEDGFEVLFEGQLPFPYRPNRISLPRDGGVVSVDLLQLYSYALNTRVGRLSLRFPQAGRYTIADIRLAQ